MKITATMVATGVLLAANHAEALSITLAAGTQARTDPMAQIEGLGTPPANANAAEFVLSSAPETLLIAEQDPAQPGKFWLKYPGKLAAGESVTLEFKGWKNAPDEQAGGPTDAFTVLGPTGKTAWTYVAAVDPAPAGKSAAFARSGFIHPLCAPDGAVLSGTRPADHYHHMGLWHAWTKTHFRGKAVDFWNIGDETGAVRFKEYRWRHRGQVWQGAEIRQEHVAWPGKPDEQVVLDEALTLRSWQANEAIVLDYSYTQKNVATEPLELEVYRYGGGLGFRGRPDWQKGTSDYLTSEGKSRSNAHSTRATWLAASGKTDGTQKGGMVILGHPSNVDAPQRVRTWQDDHGGAVFANYVPTQEKPISLKPGEKLTLHYRVVTFVGLADAARINAFYLDFANPVSVTLHP